ncbi:hypothetical protein PT974_03478 [Cladobotryum mycophilum]|uniref:DUF7918 domain-containing protein n=1 Tax=Cladobotryum mycophilum TaxID=491253 RepID=A0ABR0STN1_9HYPO
MPCFKGIAVSIHANSAPLPEHGMQKQSRLSRISTYIPVPQPSLNADTKKPEPAKFAISITLLTPGLPIPYSAPKPSESNPYPKPQFVGGLQQGPQNDRGKFSGGVTPYIPMTNSENETIAARRNMGQQSLGSGPRLRGGGLAEREFLFREVGLERWLNGLDLKGHDAAEKLEKRRQKFEKRRRRQEASLEGNTPVETDQNGRRSTLRYGNDTTSPIEAVYDDSDSWSDDDDEPPEATGQIKVAMFRVLASGEIKKGEYSPQFDAHDGDDEYEGNNVDADVEHTTSFAKPKTLDPKTISTQTVTGIDGPDKPYATFTFFYRGERQLQKIGVIQSSKNSQTTSSSAKRRSGQIDFSNLGPLKSGGTVGFSAFRDQDTEAARRRKARKKSNGNVAEDSDEDEEDDEILVKMEDEKESDPSKLAPEDAKFQGELADGVNRIHLKRAHSAEPDGNFTPDTSQRTGGNSPNAQGSSGEQTLKTEQSGEPSALESLADAMVGSPLKKARPSVDQTNNGERYSNTQSLSAALSSIVSGVAETSTPAPTTAPPLKVEEEEEL